MKFKYIKQKLVIKIFLFLFLFFGFCFFINIKPVDKKTEKIKINNLEFNVELAVTKEEQYLGLSNRKFLEEFSGMLFIFSEKKERAFVMRDMNFSLDIVFIDENEIIDIYKSLPFNKGSQNILYKSSRPADKVLELNGGFCEKNNINVGDKIFF